jgi:hypothetical protein
MGSNCCKYPNVFSPSAIGVTEIPVDMQTWDDLANELSSLDIEDGKHSQDEQDSLWSRRHANIQGRNYSLQPLYVP